MFKQTYNTKKKQKKKKQEHQNLRIMFAGFSLFIYVKDTIENEAQNWHNNNNNLE